MLVNQKLYQNGSVFWRLWQTSASLAPAIQKSDRLNEVAVLGDVHVYELHSREIQPMSEELIPNPGFESGTTTEIQGWTRVGQPKIDHSGTQAHAGASSCLVTPSDYFVSYPVSIKPGRCYLLQAFGRRGKNKAAYLRLKIVWLDALRHPLDPSTTSVRLVELNDQWESARHAFLAPQESHYATVYAVTQSGSGNGLMTTRFASYRRIVSRVSSQSRTPLCNPLLRTKAGLQFHGTVTPAPARM